MNWQQANHARIMVECGCSIEDVCVSLRLPLIAAIYAVAPALDHNPALRKRVRYMLGERGLPVPDILVIHRRGGRNNDRIIRNDDARIAA